MKADVIVRHMTPFRARLQVPSRKKDEKFFTTICDVLHGCQGVDSVKANPLTGSVVVSFRDELKDILQEFQQKNPFSLDIAKVKAVKPQPLAQAYNTTLKSKVRTFDKVLLQWTGGGVDFISLVGLGLIGLSVYQFRRGVFLPAGFTLALLSLRLANSSFPIEVENGGVPHS